MSTRPLLVEDGIIRYADDECLEGPWIDIAESRTIQQYAEDTVNSYEYADNTPMTMDEDTFGDAVDELMKDLVRDPLRVQEVVDANPKKIANELYKHKPR